MSPDSKKDNIVIASHHDDLEWIADFFCDEYEIDVYETGTENDTICKDLANIHLHAGCPQIGMAARRYLHHIELNWDNLSEYEHILFFQGKDRPEIPRKRLLSDVNSFQHRGEVFHSFFMLHPFWRKKWATRAAWCDLDSWALAAADKFKITIHNNLQVAFYSHFSVSVERIYEHEREWYQMWLKYAENEQKAPWVLERLWMEIF